jgi:hypothetical protein
MQYFKKITDQKHKKRGKQSQIQWHHQLPLFQLIALDNMSSKKKKERHIRHYKIDKAISSVN